MRRYQSTTQRPRPEVCAAIGACSSGWLTGSSQPRAAERAQIPAGFDVDRIYGYLYSKTTSTLRSLGVQYHVVKAAFNFCAQDSSVWRERERQKTGQAQGRSEFSGVGQAKLQKCKYRQPVKYLSTCSYSSSTTNPATAREGLHRALRLSSFNSFSSGLRCCSMSIYRVHNSGSMQTHLIQPIEGEDCHTTLLDQLLGLLLFRTL